MTQYEAIFQRSSVRRFQMRTIEPKIMEQLNYFIQSVSPLHPEALYRIAVVEAGSDGDRELRPKCRVEAPYYLVFSAKEHSFAAKNAGFVMEQIVLYLTSKGIGTCYLSDFKLSKAADNYRTMIVVAFGRPASAMAMGPSRKGRKKAADLAYFKEETSGNVRRILEAGRMAPSAGNGQPWRFVVYANRIHIFMKHSALAMPRRQELREISMGIVMTHMALAAEEQWMNWKLSSIGDVAERELKGYVYVATLSLSDQEFPL